MKKFSIIQNRLSCLLVVLLLLLTACSPEQSLQSKPLDIMAAASDMTITASDTKVSDFLAINKDFKPTHETDTAYNITPGFVSENSSFAIFKYDASTASFLMYDNEVYPMGMSFGGLGVTSMALADLDEDYQYELYFTFSWGSGLHRSQVGYFNPNAGEITVFDYSYMNSDMMLTTNDTGDLCVMHADITGDSFVNFTARPVSLIGNIISEENNITLKMTDD